MLCLFQMVFSTQKRPELWTGEAWVLQVCLYSSYLAKIKPTYFRLVSQPCFHGIRIINFEIEMRMGDLQLIYNDVRKYILISIWYLRYEWYNICIIYMYICIYVYMYICIYVYMYICIYVYMYICIYVYMYICIYVYMYICIYVYMYICIHILRSNKLRNLELSSQGILWNTLAVRVCESGPHW